MIKFLLATLILALAFGASSVAQAANPVPSWPAYVYKDGGDPGNLWTPSGWMGNFTPMNLTVNASSADTSVSGTSTKISFTGGTINPEWVGVYWLWPDSNWGTDPDGGWDLTGAQNLTFWARGAVGGEKINFKIGGVGGTYGDTLTGINTGNITLASTWTQYSIPVSGDLSGYDLSRVVGGFEFDTNDTLNPSGATFYVDDVQYNPVPEPASLLLLGTGLVGLAGFVRRRK